MGNSILGPTPDTGAPPAEVPIPDWRATARAEALGRQDAGEFDSLWAKFRASAAAALVPVIRLLISIMDDILALVVEFFTAAQGTNTPGFFTLVTAVIADLLGVPVNEADITNAFRRGGNIAGVRAIGGKLFDQLASEFGGGSAITPEGGIGAAKAFLGFLMAFSIRQGNLEVITQLLPEEFRIAEGVRSYGELMAENLGLGRLARRALQPLLQILIQDPMTWFLNRQYRPKLLGATQAIKAHNRGLMDDQTFNAEIAFDGYNEQRANALTEETLEQVAASDLYTLLRYGHIDRDQFMILMRRRGMHPVDAGRYLEAAQLAEASGEVTSYLTLLKTQRLAGFIDAASFNGQVDSLPLSDEHKRRFRDLIGQELEAPRKSLTLGEMQTAYVDGLIDLSELQTFLAREGYSADDQLTLQYQTLIKLDNLEARQAVALYKWNKAKKKAAAAGEPEPPPPAILAQ
jgi:hypothetical protein